MNGFGHKKAGRTYDRPSRRGNILYGKTFAATAAAAGVGITEMKSFSVQAVGEFEGGIAEIKKAFQIGDQFHTIIFKNLIFRVRLIIKVHFVAETGTATAYYGYPEKIICPKLAFLHQVFHLAFCLIADVNHNISVLRFLRISVLPDRFSAGNR